jgi:hypothetical protein
MMTRSMPSVPRRFDGDGPYLCTRRRCGGVCDVTPARVTRAIPDPEAIARLRAETGSRGLWFALAREVRILHFRCRACRAECERIMPGATS